MQLRSTRRSPAVVLAAGLLLTLTACGARVDSGLRQQAADAQLRQGGGVLTGSTDGGTTGGSGDTGTSGSSGTTGGSTTGGTTGGSTGSGGTTGGSTGSGGTTGSGGAPAPAGGNGGATDVGVTATSITLGAVADISGPVPGLFKGSVVGAQAYFAKVNSEGGIFGRQLKLDIGDGQLDCGQNKAQTQARINRVFAMVGSFSLYDDCGQEVLSQHPDIPDVHGALGAKSQVAKSNFSPAPLGNGWRTGPLQYWKAKFPDRWTKIGAIYANVGTGPDIWAHTKAAIAASGGKVLRDEPYGATDTDFTGAVIRMRSAGVQMIYINTTDGATSARFVNAVKSQNVDWPLVFGATAYDANFLKQAGANAEGVYNDQQFAMFFNADEGARIPEVGTYQKWVTAVDKRQPKDIFTVYGWSSAQLFVEALKKAGPKAKRADLMAALRSIDTFDNKILAPSGPASKRPAVCWLVDQVQKGKYVRILPPTGFRCDGTYFVDKG